jgi:DNA polymerase III delta prime subunit
VRQLKKIAAALGMETEDLVVGTYQSEIENKPRQKDAELIVEILDKKPEISRALLRYAQYLSKQEDT